MKNPFNSKKVPSSDLRDHIETFPSSHFYNFVLIKIKRLSDGSISFTICPNNPCFSPDDYRCVYTRFDHLVLDVLFCDSFNFIS